MSSSHMFHPWRRQAKGYLQIQGTRFLLMFIVATLARTHPIAKLPKSPTSRIEGSPIATPSPTASPPPSAAPIELNLPQNITKLVLSIARNLEPMLPPEDDESVAVLVVEPNAGVAHALEDKYHKKRNVSRLFVLNCAIEGPPEEVDSEEIIASFGRDVSSILQNAGVEKLEQLEDGDDGGQMNEVSRNTEGRGNKQRQKTVPIVSLATLLEAVPKNVTLEIL